MVNKNMETAKMGEYTFLVGIALAVLTALDSAFTNIASAYVAEVGLLLAIFGIVVGILNVSEKHSTAFLVAAIALVTAGTASFSVITMAGIGALLDSVVGNLAVLTSPAAVIVAAKAVYNLANGRA
jgi:hypothetical protein